MAFPDGWSRKCKITARGSQIIGSNSNFLALITHDDLPAEMLDGGVNSALNGGGDVVATFDPDGLVRLDLDVVAFVTGGIPYVEMYVKFPDLIEDINRGVWFWYGKSGQTQPTVSAPFGGNAAWSAAQSALVMESATPIDRTGNHVFNLIGALTNIAGLYGRANQFSDSDRLWNEDPTLRDILSTYDTTVSIISRRSAYSGTASTVLSWDGTDDLIILPMDTGSGNGPRLFWRDLGKNIIDINSEALANTWVHTSFTTRASDDHEAYTNGTSVGTSSNTGAAGPFSRFYVGGWPGQNFNGDIDQAIVWKTARSTGWVETEKNNKTSIVPFFSVGTPEDAISVAVLAVQNGICGHAADVVSLSQGQNLVIGGSDHTHVTDSPTITQNQLINVDPAYNAVISNQLNLSHLQNMSVADAAHEHVVDNAAIEQGLTLSISEVGHSLQSDVVDQTHFQILGPTNAINGLSSDQVSLSQFLSLSPNSDTLSQLSDQVSLTQGQMLDADHASHSIDSDEVTLSQLMGLAADNVTHGFTSGQASIFNPADLMVSPERTLTLPAENRTYRLPTENRTLRI
ncbi:MAG: hypothetical protein JKY45_05655 [Emcibacter sp.]|nr:hypothetical protein [Emcibacter sp.]